MHEKPKSARYVACNDCGARMPWAAYSSGGCSHCGYYPQADDPVLRVDAGRAELLGLTE